MEKNLLQSTSFVKKIAFVGPECTGKTTMCKILAEHYKTNWVPEFMRSYLQKKWDTSKETCTWEDLLPIAIGQISAENEAVTKSKNLLFCDTNLFELMVYANIYYQKCPEILEKYALSHQYDMIFLTFPDIPWVADDLRDKPNERIEIFTIFEQFLKKYHQPYFLLKGDENLRFETTTNIINSWKI